MARYALLMFLSDDLYDADTADPTDASGAGADVDGMRLHEQFMAAVQAAGAAIVGGEALERPSTASTVRGGGDGDPLVTDGPFADTKEALGGFYIVDAPDRDTALRVAAACPCSNVEVRPVMELPDAG